MYHLCGSADRRCQTHGVGAGGRLPRHRLHHQGWFSAQCLRDFQVCSHSLESMPWEAVQVFGSAQSYRGLWLGLLAVHVNKRSQSSASTWMVENPQWLVCEYLRENPINVLLCCLILRERQGLLVLRKEPAGVRHSSISDREGHRSWSAWSLCQVPESHLNLVLEG